MVRSLELSFAHAPVVVVETVVAVIRVMLSCRASRLRAIRIKQLCRLWWPSLDIVLSRSTVGDSHHALRREARHRSLVR